MEPSIGMALLWALFGAAHIGLTTHRARRALAERYGERAFINRYSLLAGVLFSLLIVYYAVHRHEGAAGLALATVPGLHTLGLFLIGSGVVLMAASFSGYADSPMSIIVPGVRPPRGIARISRHCFFAGLTVFAIAHGLLATKLVGTVFFAGFALVSIIGARHQDQKLLARHGEPYAGYLAATSALPFGAMLSGRQRLPLAEFPWLAVAVGVAIAFALRQVHASIFAYGGGVFVALVLAGVGSLFLQELMHRRRSAGRETALAGSGEAPGERIP